MPWIVFRLNRLGVALLERQVNHENATSAYVAAHRDVSAHQANEFATDRQTESSAGSRLLPGLGLLKMPEQFVLILWRNAWTCILDFNAENDPDLVSLISDKTPRREAGINELQEKLNEAMQKLSPSHRLVVTLHDVQGLAHDEIATIMECNIGTVRSRLFYARQQLQATLSDYLK